MLIAVPAIERATIVSSASRAIRYAARGATRPTMGSNSGSGNPQYPRGFGRFVFLGAVAL